MAEVKLACRSLIPRKVHTNGDTAPVMAGERWMHGDDSAGRLRAKWKNMGTMGWVFEMLRDGGKPGEIKSRGEHASGNRARQLRPSRACPGQPSHDCGKITPRIQALRELDRAPSILIPSYIMLDAHGYQRLRQVCYELLLPFPSSDQLCKLPLAVRVPYLDTEHSLPRALAEHHPCTPFYQSHPPRRECFLQLRQVL